MTLSIVARDYKTGDFGVCGYTDIAGYGSLVPHVSLRGAVATQAYVNVDNGIELLELLDKKYTLANAGKKIIQKDKNRSMRQMIAIGLNNSFYEWTGKDILDYKNSIIGKNFIVSGNCMDSFKVIESCANYFRNNINEEFPLRLINSINAGERSGGHIKKVSYMDKRLNKIVKKSTKSVFGSYMSSAILIASKNPKICNNLRIDSSKKPIHDLKKIYFDAQKSSNKLNKFYNGAIKVNPFFWRKIS